MSIEETLVDDVDESKEVILYRYSITSYGADYPVDSLVKRLKAGDIVVPTFDPEAKPVDSVEGYQRQFIWTVTQCERFIESLLLGLPVPGIFLVKQEDGRFLVLDGQQRLRTLQAFYGGVLRSRVFFLGPDNVQAQFAGLTYETLPVEDRRRLDDSIIHATIVRQDQPSNDQSSIYLIFERLNTGGTSLQPQEVRVALYSGGLVRLLRDINGFEPWRAIYGKRSNRFKDQELILRFFAFLFWEDKYEKPMKEFLNRYTAENRDFQMQSEAQLRKIFQLTVTLALDAFGKNAFRLKTAINAAVMDSIMVAIADRQIKQRPITDLDALRRKYIELLANDDYRQYVEKSTADEENVKKRLKLARDAFADVE